MVRVVGSELRLRIVSELCLLLWPHENAGNAEARDDTEDLVGAVEVGANEEELGHLRVQRHLSHLVTDVRHVSLVVKRSVVVKKFQRPHESLRRWGVKEIKVHEVVYSQFLERKHHGGHLGSENLGIGCLLEVVLEGHLSVKTEAFTGLRTPRSSGPLLRASLADGADEEGLYPRPGVEYFLFAETRVYDVDDAVDRQGGFGNVGGDNNLAPWDATGHFRTGGGGEDFTLGSGGEGTVERVHDELPDV